MDIQAKKIETLQKRKLELLEKMPHQTPGTTYQDFSAEVKPFNVGFTDSFFQF